MDGSKSKLKRAKKKLSSEFFDCCSVVKDRQGHIVDVEGNVSGECGC
jgi:hypothetical protein